MSPITRNYPTHPSPALAGNPDHDESLISEPANKTNYSRAGLLFLFILVLLFLGSTAFYYRENSKLKSNPEKAAEESIVDLVSKVSKLIVLPQGETPIIATITDADKLKKEQAFFANANVGDKILIYPKVRKAFLYNPKLNILVEVAPIILGEPNKQANTQTQPTSPPAEQPLQQTATNTP